MLTLVFLFFIVLFAIAGIFISIEARRSRARSGAAAASPAHNQPHIGRAISGKD